MTEKELKEVDAFKRKQLDAFEIVWKALSDTPWKESSTGRFYRDCIIKNKKPY